MSGAKQIITVQLGGFANHVGAHYWNLQQAEIHRREDSTRELSGAVNMRHTEDELGNESYNPRAVTLGLKGSLGAISTDGDLVGDLDLSGDCEGWGGSLSVIQQTRIQPSESLARWNEHELEAHPSDGSPAEAAVDVAETDPRYWTDFCAARFHPKSHLLLPGVASSQFGSFAHGNQLMKQGLGEELLERVRWFAEECDSLQVVHRTLFHL